MAIKIKYIVLYTVILQNDHFKDMTSLACFDLKQKLVIKSLQNLKNYLQVYMRDNYFLSEKNIEVQKLHIPRGVVRKG